MSSKSATSVSEKKNAGTTNPDALDGVNKQPAVDFNAVIEPNTKQVEQKQVDKSRHQISSTSIHSSNTESQITIQTTTQISIKHQAEPSTNCKSNTFDSIKIADRFSDDVTKNSEEPEKEQMNNDTSSKHKNDIKEITDEATQNKKEKLKKLRRSNRPGPKCSKVYYEECELATQESPITTTMENDKRNSELECPKILDELSPKEEIAKSKVDEKSLKINEEAEKQETSKVIEDNDVQFNEWKNRKPTRSNSTDGIKNESKKIKRRRNSIGAYMLNRRGKNDLYKRLFPDQKRISNEVNKKIDIKLDANKWGKILSNPSDSKTSAKPQKFENCIKIDGKNLDQSHLGFVKLVKSNTKSSANNEDNKTPKKDLPKIESSGEEFLKRIGSILKNEQTFEALSNQNKPTNKRVTRSQSKKSSVLN